MTRRVLTKSDLQELKDAGKKGLALLDAQAAIQTKVAPAPAPAPDEYLARLLKLIPADVVAAFVFIDGIIRSTGSQVSVNVYWGIFGVLTVVTYFYVLRTTRVGELKGRRSQAFISALSFVVWVLAIGGPFSYSHVEWYTPIYGTIALPIYTLVVPIVFGDFSKSR